MLTFTFEALQEIAGECLRSEGRQEVGGVLGGRRELNGAEVRSALPVENCAEDPRRTYIPDHEAMMPALHCLDREELQLLGTFHTHPGGRAVMSGTDVALAQSSGLLLLIGLPATGEMHRPWEWRAYDPWRSAETSFAVRPPLSAPI